MKRLILLLACASVVWTQSCDPQPGAVNLAPSGVASQSSVFPLNPPPDASTAIDGNFETNYYKHPCAHTQGDRDPWWKLDLGKSVNIDSVFITNRQDCCQERLKGAQVKVGNSPDGNNPVCATINDVSKVKIPVCCNGLEGRYVTVTIPGRSEYLTLCEVEVYGRENKKQEPSVCW
ncbi:pentraxin fusion protein-like [Pelobates fuscus]|uniref:pentraxin fusion protein-like n=1 Tax=Pelobates fuscus TaxID=191477 RepID=UPI002FE4AFF2